MYALVSIEKFLGDNADLVGDQAEAIMECAKEHSSQGLIYDHLIHEIMGDQDLAQKFRRAAASDVS